LRIGQSEPETDRTDGKDIAIAAMEARIESLESQLTAKDQQIDQLHHLLAQTALKEAPATTLVEILGLIRRLLGPLQAGILLGGSPLKHTV